MSSIYYKLLKYFNWYISWKPLTDLILFLEQLIKLGSNNLLYQLKYKPSWSNDKTLIQILSKMVYKYTEDWNTQLKNFNISFQEAQGWESEFEQILEQKYSITFKKDLILLEDKFFTNTTNVIFNAIGKG